MSVNTVDFFDIVKQNKKRIHYHIHRLNIRDPHDDFYQEGLIALWDAYRTYEEDKGSMSTYFNYIIRNRLIDQIRRYERTRHIDEASIKLTEIEQTDGNHKTQVESRNTLPKQESLPLPDDEFWFVIKDQLTEKQWIWVYYYVIRNWSQVEIAEEFNTSVAAVKSWAQQVRKKLKNDQFKQLLYEYILS